MRLMVEAGPGRGKSSAAWFALVPALLAALTGLLLGACADAADPGAIEAGVEREATALPTVLAAARPEPTTFELLPEPTPTAVPTTAPVPTATPLPTPTAVPIVEHTLLFSGDVLSHTPVIAAAQAYGDGGAGDWPYDYRPMFDDVRARVSAADLAICVLETPVSPDNSGLAGYPLFNAPRELPAALVDAGYDGCSTASNHSIDKGPSGLTSTLDEMDRVGLGHAGMYRSADEAATPTLYELDSGLVVAHLSFTYGLNGLVLPADAPWMVDVNDVEAIRAKAAAARGAGADLVVLSIQWGNEYQRSPSAAQLELAPLITADGGVDLVMGNHVHVVQPVAVVNGVPVIYGLGNSLSNQYDRNGRSGTQDGVMIEVTVTGNDATGWTIGDIAYAPTWVDRSTYTIIDLVTALGAMAPDDPLRPTLQQAFDRTTEAVLLLGADVRLADPIGE